MKQLCKRITDKLDDGTVMRCGEPITHVNVPCGSCGRFLSRELLHSTARYI